MEPNIIEFGHKQSENSLWKTAALIIAAILMGLLCSCTSNYLTITYEIGDICITRQMYPRYSVLTCSCNMCSDAGQIIIQERKGEYEAVLAFDTCQSIVYVASMSGTSLIPKHIDTTIWRVHAPDRYAYEERCEEMGMAYLNYDISQEIYYNSGFYETRKSRQNTRWNIRYPNRSKWNIEDMGYIGGLFQPNIILPNADDSTLVLQFVEKELKNIRYVSISNYRHDCCEDIIKKGNDGCQLFHVFYECQNGNGEMILVKDSSNNITDHINIVLQSNDTIHHAEENVIRQCHSRVNSRECYVSVSVETTEIRSVSSFEKNSDTIITRIQYDLRDGHYLSHPVKDIIVYEKTADIIGKK